MEIWKRFNLFLHHPNNISFKQLNALEKAAWFQSTVMRLNNSFGVKFIDSVKCKVQNDIDKHHTRASNPFVCCLTLSVTQFSHHRAEHKTNIISTRSLLNSDFYFLSRLDFWNWLDSGVVFISISSRVTLIKSRSLNLKK